MELGIVGFIRPNQLCISVADFGVGNFRIESKYIGKGSMHSFKIQKPAKSADF